MTPPVFTHRLRWLGLTLTLAYLALAVWIGHFQTLRRAEYVAYKAANHGARHPLPARRGAIKDVHGAVLAVSAPVRTVCVDPGIAAGLPELYEPCRMLTATTVAEVLGMEVERVYAKLQPRWIRRGETEILDRYEILQRDVPLERWRRLTNELAHLRFPFNEKRLPTKTRLQLEALRQRAVFSEPGYRRLYPSGRLAPHLLGLVRVREANQPYGVWRWEEGVMGIERQFDHHLHGAPGYRVGRERLMPVDGANVVLTLDVGAQRIVRTALLELMQKQKAEGAVAVVVRPRTGDVVSMVSLPDFDPAGVERIDTLRNWAVAAQIEPGSTFKAVTFAAALERVRLPWDQKVDCEDGLWWVVRGRHSDRIRDFHPYHELSWLDVLRKSSNIGTGKLAERFVPPDFFHEVCEALGFNEVPELYLPEAVRGNVPRPDRRSTYLRMVFGQSVAVTPLHMAMAYATIANGGVLMRPRLVARVEDDEGRVLLDNPPTALRRVFSRATTTNLTWALKQVVSPGGTGHLVESRLYTIAGKTGTAQWYDPEFPNPYTADRKGGYPPGADYPSFVGFFPASEPELCMLIGLIKPRSPGRHGGGAVVGPTWKRVAEQLGNYLRIRPDRQAAPDWLPGPPPGPWPDTPLAITPSPRLPEEVYW